MVGKRLLGARTSVLDPEWRADSMHRPDVQPSLPGSLELPQSEAQLTGFPPFVTNVGNLSLICFGTRLARRLLSLGC